LLWIDVLIVPANEIIGAKPGEVFVSQKHNMVIHSDEHVECFDYAVNVLKVKHVIVCGHGCGCQSRYGQSIDRIN
jgi:carbonic anhydrase